MENNIIDLLDSIDKLIEEEKYMEAKNCIKKAKEKLKTKKDASDYMDKLIDDLK